MRNIDIGIVDNIGNCTDQQTDDESSEEETSSDEESLDLKTAAVPIRKKFDDEEDSDDVSGTGNTPILWLTDCLRSPTTGKRPRTRK